MTASPQNSSGAAGPGVLRGWLTRSAALGLVWLGLNGVDGRSWIVGGPTVIAATWLSLRLIPAFRWRGSVRGALGFLGFFLRESLRGGWDVARRALGPSVSLAPALVLHRFRLPVGAARWFFSGTISLLPGTAVVAVEEEQLRIHVLDEDTNVAEELRQLEQRVAALFGEPLMNEAGDRR